MIYGRTIILKGNRMPSIIDDFDLNKERYESFSKTLRSLLNSLILNDGVNVHSISSRVKNRKSLEKKIISKGSYSHIDDITDVIGIRIITHFADEVDIIAQIIEGEFKVDRANSIDKRATLEPDRFGYLSLHYVIELNDSRSILKEYIPYKNLKAEVQIRSILQHTWAEIEHDIGYKSSSDVPHLIRRQFSRLAGLLELADDEFIKIKKSLEDYKAHVSIELEHNTELDDLTLDRVSYAEYLKSSPLINKIKKEIAEETGVVISFGLSSASPFNQLSYFGINTIKELNNAFIRLEDRVKSRAIRVISKINKKEYGKLPIEVLGIYLAQALAFESGDKSAIIKYIIDNDIRSFEKAEDFANELVQSFTST